MATKKPAVKKAPAKAAKQPTKTEKKPVVKTKPIKPATKKVSANKIAVKPAVKTAKVAKKPSKKTGLAKPQAKMVVDTIKLPTKGKVFVKAAKRPRTFLTAKKAKKN